MEVSANSQNFRFRLVASSHSKFVKPLQGTSMIRRFHEYFEISFLAGFCDFAHGQLGATTAAEIAAHMSVQVLTRQYHSLTYLPLSRADSDSLSRMTATALASAFISI